jgi:hypothetical protein
VAALIAHLMVLMGAVGATKEEASI